MCHQIPLLLGFALTIHQSQGMTPPSVALHYEVAYASGQIGVSLSRVRSPSDITVYNFRHGLCPPHSPVLQDFYAKHNEGYPMVDLSCCSELSVFDPVHVAIQPLVNGDGCDDKCKSVDNHDDFDDDDDDDDFTFFLTITKILLNKLTIQTMMYTHLTTAICLMIWNPMPYGRNSSRNLLSLRPKSISNQFYNVSLIVPLQDGHSSKSWNLILPWSDLVLKYQAVKC